MYIKETYREVKDAKTVSANCCLCNGKLTRTLTASQTINPWNQKSSSQIHEENWEKLKIYEKQFSEQKHKCGKCIKAVIPDFDCESLTESDIDEALRLQEEASVYEKEVNIRHNKIKKLIANKKIFIQDRLAVTEEPYDISNYQLQYNFIRKDGKGLLDKVEYDWRVGLADLKQFLI